MKKDEEMKLAHHKHGFDIYKDKQDAYYIKRGGQYFRLDIPPGRLEPPNPNRPNIIVLYENPDTKEYENAAPYVIMPGFKLQDHKIRGYFKDDGHFYRLSIRIDGKRKKTYKISASKILHCTRGNWIYEDQKFYIFLETLSIFVREFTETFAIRYLKLPRQLNLPLYQQPPVETNFQHPSLEIL